MNISIEEILQTYTSADNAIVDTSEGIDGIMHHSVDRLW